MGTGDWGLGLSVTYDIIEKHNRAMLFESTVNKGTTVKILVHIHSFKLINQEYPIFP